jgi:hypothetical protein
MQDHHGERNVARVKAIPLRWQRKIEVLPASVYRPEKRHMKYVWDAAVKNLDSSEYLNHLSNLQQDHSLKAQRQRLLSHHELHGLFSC